MLLAIGADTIILLDIRRAREVSRYSYNSNILPRAAATETPVPLQSYLEIVAPALNRHPDEVLAAFRLAHCLNYVTIYEEPKLGLCVKEGEKRVKFEG